MCWGASWGVRAVPRRGFGFSQSLTGGMCGKGRSQASKAARTVCRTSRATLLGSQAALKAKAAV